MLIMLLFADNPPNNSRDYCLSSWFIMLQIALFWHQGFPTCNYPGTVTKQSDKISLILQGSCFYSVFLRVEIIKKDACDENTGAWLIWQRVPICH